MKNTERSSYLYKFVVNRCDTNYILKLVCFKSKHSSNISLNFHKEVYLGTVRVNIFLVS
jgi:hypothetical protein